MTRTDVKLRAALVAYALIAVIATASLHIYTLPPPEPEEPAMTLECTEWRVIETRRVPDGFVMDAYRVCKEMKWVEEK